MRFKEGRVSSEKRNGEGKCTEYKWKGEGWCNFFTEFTRVDPNARDNGDKVAHMIPLSPLSLILLDQSSNSHISLMLSHQHVASSKDSIAP